MFGTLATIVNDHTRWAKRIFSLARFDLVKKSRGAVLSWGWFFVKPAMYVFCFWFALEIGLRAGSSDPGAPPYILWLSAGIIPWFFISDMLNTGSDVLHRYPYLVNKVKFPLSGISTVFALATFIVQLMLQVALLGIYFACGMGLDVYLLQVPILLVLMLVFFDMVSITCSQLSAMSKDFANLMKALTTPMFWLSGVIFDVRNIQIDWIQSLLAVNPITFFASSFRGAFYDKTWFWEDPVALGGFAAVFVVTLLVMLLVYKHFNEEVSDVL